MPHRARARFLDARLLALSWTWDNLWLARLDRGCRFAGRFWGCGLSDAYGPTWCRKGKLLPIESKPLHFSVLVRIFSSQRRKTGNRRGSLRKFRVHCRSQDDLAGGLLHPPAPLGCRNRGVPEKGRADGARDTFRRPTSGAPQPSGGNHAGSGRTEQEDSPRVRERGVLHFQRLADADREPEFHPQDIQIIQS